jgi:hypothetical protein
MNIKINTGHHEPPFMTSCLVNVIYLVRPSTVFTTLFIAYAVYSITKCRYIYCAYRNWLIALHCEGSNSAVWTTILQLCEYLDLILQNCISIPHCLPARFVIHLRTLRLCLYKSEWSTSCVVCIMWDARIWKESAGICFKILLQNVPRPAEENHEKFRVAYPALKLRI